jgi:integrase
MRVKLTDLTIQNFKYQHPQVTFWDALLPAFGVRVGSRSKTFIVMHGQARKRKTLGRYPDMKLTEARDLARKFMTASGVPEHPSVTLAGAVNEYLRNIKTRSRTTAEYERLLGRHFLPALGHRPLEQLTARDILAITDRLLHTPTECRHAHVAALTFFNWCVPRYLATSPMTGLKTPTKPNKRERVLSHDELKRVWRAAGQLADFGRMVRLCILTGQRRGEVSKILPAWLSADTLTIPKQIAKNKREHIIPPAPSALELARQAPFVVGNWGRKKNELDDLSATEDWVLHDLRRTFSTTLPRSRSRRTSSSASSTMPPARSRHWPRSTTATRTSPK